MDNAAIISAGNGLLLKLHVLLRVLNDHPFNPCSQVVSIGTEWSFGTPALIVNYARIL